MTAINPLPIHHSCGISIHAITRNALKYYPYLILISFIPGIYHFTIIDETNQLLTTINAGNMGDVVAPCQLAFDLVLDSWTLHNIYSWKLD